MKNYKNGLIVLVVLIIIASVYYYLANKDKDQNVFENQIVTTSKITLTDLEKGQIEKSVDLFMNEYKLPKGVQNYYNLSIEKRLNDSIEIIVNPKEEGDLGNIVIHARKTDNVWQVDPSGGPWCTLETFDDKTCF